MSRHRNLYLMLLLGAGACTATHQASRTPAPEADPPGAPVYVNHMLIVQLLIAGDWGSDHDLEVRHRLERQLARRLGGLGVVDGGDIGSGTMNLFVVAIVDLPGALLAVKDVLERRGLLETAVIEQSSFRSAEDDDPVAKVVWPPGYQGTFSVF